MKTFVYWVICALASSVLCATPRDSIDWENVTPDDGGVAYQIGRLEVPMMHREPDGPKIQIAFARLPSTSSSPGSPIIYLNGGPGQSATPMARSEGFVSAMAPLRELGDVILLDQRGTGLSNPRLVCRYDRMDATNFLSDDFDVSREIELLKTCAATFAEKGIDIKAFNTRESALDLDDLRIALGAEKIRLLGFSYGTHLAIAAVRQLGARVERAVLVGTEGPDHTEKLPLTMDVHWKKIGLLAAADATVSKEMPDLWAATQRAMHRLAEDPMHVEIHDRRADRKVEIEVGRRGLRWLLLRDIGDTSDIPYFPALIHQIEKGDPSLLAWFVEKRFNNLGGISLMSVAMDCSSGASTERLARIERQAEVSLFGNEMNATHTICQAIGSPDLGDSFRNPLVSDVPILFVGGTLDAKTPPHQAEEVRWGLSHAAHIIVVNAGHEDAIDPPAVQEAIGSFLAGREVSGSEIVKEPVRFVPVTTISR